jgi:hypothetical protein
MKREIKQSKQTTTTLKTKQANEYRSKQKAPSSFWTELCLSNLVLLTLVVMGAVSGGRSCTYSLGFGMALRGV